MTSIRPRPRPSPHKTVPERLTSIEHTLRRLIRQGSLTMAKIDDIKTLITKLNAATGSGQV